MPILEINDLHVSVKEKEDKTKELLHGLNLSINKGEIHVIMGTNGSGKSTLASAITANPTYILTQGSIHFNGQDISNMPADERARMGIFLAMQYPVVIPGLTFGTFLKAAMEAIGGETIPIRAFRKEAEKAMEELSIPKDWLKRSLYEGFSGGEKKRGEILQMKLLKPNLAILDETDSGLDVDATKLVFESIIKEANSENAFLVITHYGKIAKFFKPTNVHIMHEGKIIKSGDASLSDIVEEKGFESFIAETVE